jgi:hypothetical protein
MKRGCKIRKSEVGSRKSEAGSPDNYRENPEPGTCWSEAEIPIPRGNSKPGTVKGKYRITNNEYSIMNNEYRISNNE